MCDSKVDDELDSEVDSEVGMGCRTRRRKKGCSVPQGKRQSGIRYIRFYLEVSCTLWSIINCK